MSIKPESAVEKPSAGGESERLGEGGTGERGVLAYFSLK